MSFQFIIDNAAEIITNNQPMVAATTTRDGTVRSVSRGGQPWVFTVTLPDGPRWSDYREAISTAQRYDRHTAQTIQFNNPGHSWLYSYQGDRTGDFLYDASQGFDTLTVTGGTGSGNRFVAGDLIQLGAAGHVYQVVTTTTGTSVRVHRPIIDASGTGTLIRGVDCTFTVKATQFPQPRIFAQNQVGWTGSWVFAEVVD